MAKLQEYAAQLKEAVEKMTPGPWSDSWTNEHGAGCTGAGTAAMTYINCESKCPVVVRPNAIRQSDKPEHWYGDLLARTYRNEDAVGIVALRNLVPPLLEEIGKQGWISVEDRLPADGQWVIVNDQDGVHPDMYCDAPAVFTGWCNSNNVTHWQPLPKPPEITSSGEDGQKYELCPANIEDVGADHSNCHDCRGTGFVERNGLRRG